MTIKLVKRPPNGAELRLEGRLDTSTAGAAETALTKVSGEYTQIELNFSELQYISSAGLRVLLKVQKIMNARGGRLTLAHVSPAIIEVFEMTGFSSILNIEND